MSKNNKKKDGLRRNETNSKVEELGSTRGITQESTRKGIKGEDCEGEDSEGERFG